MLIFLFFFVVIDRPLGVLTVVIEDVDGQNYLFTVFMAKSI